jgi:hypothetical protein
LEDAWQVNALWESCVARSKKFFSGPYAILRKQAPDVTLCDQTTRAPSLMREVWSIRQMKQDDKGGKRSADGVGESQHAGRWSRRATGDENSGGEPEPGGGSSLVTGLGYRRLPRFAARL